MRSTTPMPGNPWPHDMVIRGEDHPNSLLDLLWVREAYGLDVGADIPPLLVTPERVETDADTRADWSARWPAVWQAALAHAADAGRSDPEAIGRAAPGSPERLALIQAAAGPNWRSEVGDEAFQAPQHRTWRDSLPRPERPRRLEDHPERRDLEALILAWRAGLTTIVRLPVAGPVAQRIGEHGLLVDEATRADSAAYRRALAGFAG